MPATCHVTISVMHLGTFTNAKATIVTLRSCKIQSLIMLLLQHSLSFFCHHSNWHHGVMSPSTHRPWQSHLKRWPQPGGHKPTFRSTLRAPEPCGAWGNRARAASRQGCSAARSRSARHGTCTGTYSWGKRSVRSDRQNRPTHMHHRRELQGRKKGLNYCVGPRMFDQVIYHSGVGGWGCSPTQMPVLLWTSVEYSHRSPLRVSQGFMSEHGWPLCRAHTRQQAQSSRIRGTPGGHSGGSSGHWHLRGQTWDQVTWQEKK